MGLDSRPVFRRVITPWYDSDTACLVVITLMGASLVFGLAGIQAALETDAYHRFVWLPILVCFLSGIVIITTAYRLIMRHIQKQKENMLMPHVKDLPE